MVILVSACLLGTPCRYDGESRPSPSVLALLKKHTLIPVCPEILGGLPTPRVPAERQGERVINQRGEDVSAAYERGAREARHLFSLYNAKAALLKAKSPSCGKGEIYDGSFSHRLKEGNGVTAEALLSAGIPVFTEKEIPALEAFLASLS